MNLKPFYNLISVIFTAMLILFPGCKENNLPDIPGEDDGHKHNTVLLYAVASNNLYSNLVSDKKEILKAAGSIDLSKNAFFVYEVTPNEIPQLLKLRQVTPDSCAFMPVKDYDRSLYSTDPERISEVIADLRDVQSSDRYGLILWSHGTGLDPAFSDHPSSRVSHPVLRSFGWDCDKDKDSNYFDQTDIDELADAIPDNFFDFIWFDACYMSGIETAYELRDKCNYFVAYPTEVFTSGMPYDLTVPYIMKETPDLVGAARAFFNHYADYPSSSMRVATIAVLDMSKIEPVADFCKTAYAGGETPDAFVLQKYTRGKIGPFYDFGQYTRMMASSNPSGLSSEEFDSLLDDLVIFKAATDVDFNYVSIDRENYSGLSCHRYEADDNSAKGKFYRTLDWWKRVY